MAGTSVKEVLETEESLRRQYLALRTASLSSTTKSAADATELNQVGTLLAQAHQATLAVTKNVMVGSPFALSTGAIAVKTGNDVVFNDAPINPETFTAPTPASVPVKTPLLATGFFGSLILVITSVFGSWLVFNHNSKPTPAPVPIPTPAPVNPIPTPVPVTPVPVVPVPVPVNPVPIVPTPDPTPIPNVPVPPTPSPSTPVISPVLHATYVYDAENPSIEVTRIRENATIQPTLAPLNCVWRIVDSNSLELKSTNLDTWITKIGSYPVLVIQDESKPDPVFCAASPVTSDEIISKIKTYTNLGK